MFTRCILIFALLSVCLPVGAAEDTPAVKYPLSVTGPKPKPAETPPAEQLDASIRRGVEFLLKRQNANGSWGAARNTKSLESSGSVALLLRSPQNYPICADKHEMSGLVGKGRRHS